MWVRFSQAGCLRPEVQLGFNPHYNEASGSITLSTEPSFISITPTRKDCTAVDRDFTLDSLSDVSIKGTGRGIIEPPLTTPQASASVIDVHSLRLLPAVSYGVPSPSIAGAISSRPILAQLYPLFRQEGNGAFKFIDINDAGSLLGTHSTVIPPSI